MKRRDFLGVSVAGGRTVAALLSGSAAAVAQTATGTTAGAERPSGSLGEPIPIAVHAQLPLPKNGRQLARRRDGLWFFTYASHPRRGRDGAYLPGTEIRIRVSRVPNIRSSEDFGQEQLLVRDARGAYSGPKPRPETGGYVIDGEGAAHAGTKPSIVIDPKDVLHLAWVRQGAGEIWFARCDVSGSAGPEALGRTQAWRHANGGNIGAERIAEGGADLDDICLDQDGRPCLVYQSEKGIFFACYDGGRWRHTILVKGSDSRWPILACDGTGVLHVVFVASRGRGSGLLHYLRSDDGGLRWTGAGGKTTEPDLIGGYCSEAPSLAATGKEVLVAHHQGFRVVTFSHFDGKKWRDNTVVPRSYNLNSPMLTLDRHDVVWMHMVHDLYDWSLTSRWLGDGWSDPQEGRHLATIAHTCSAERVMAGGAHEFGILLADRSHRLYFDTIPVPAPATEKGSRTMFLDLLEVAALTDVRQVVEPMEKDPRNPLLKHGEPGSWDAMQANFQGTILKEGNRYRVWYTGLNKKPYFEFDSACGYAESTDGVKWTKPELGLHEYGGNKRNNICFPYGFHYNVLKMTEELERDPARRYRMAFTADSVLLAYSPDGIHWTLSPQNPLWRTSQDARCQYCGVDNVTYIHDTLDPNPDRRFKAYPQVTVGSKNRVSGLLISPDGIRFREYPNNPAIDADLGVEKQNHMIEVCWQRHGMFIGLYGCYLDNVNVDARLAVSRDGVHWVRVKNEVPFLPAGEPGSCDGGMVFPSNYPIIEGEDVWIYYSGVEFNFASGEGHASMGRARVRLDGFAKMELDPGRSNGVLTTIPFEVLEPERCRLVVNAERLSPGKRSLLVEVLDGETGNPLPRFTAEDCDPLTRDGTAIPVTWRNRSTLSGIPARRIRFRFLFSGIEGSPRLCSFGFE